MTAGLDPSHELPTDPTDSNGVRQVFSMASGILTDNVTLHAVLFCSGLLTKTISNRTFNTDVNRALHRKASETNQSANHKIE